MKGTACWQHCKQQVPITATVRSEEGKGLVSQVPASGTSPPRVCVVSGAQGPAEEAVKTLRAEGSSGPKFLLSGAFLWTEPFITACLTSSWGDALGASAASLKRLECCGNGSFEPLVQEAHALGCAPSLSQTLRLEEQPLLGFGRVESLQGRLAKRAD